MGISNHILLQPDFWSLFHQEVEIKKSWKCHFTENSLTQNIKEDSILYHDDTIFLRRRHGIDVLSKNDNVWTGIVLGACKELAQGQDGKFVLELKSLHVLEALRDYVNHLDYFYKVASIMDERTAEKVLTNLEITPIHDIDKLDPIMLVAYSERFEDNKSTSLWFTCVDHHVKSNPHHQAHYLWAQCCQCKREDEQEGIITCDTCDRMRTLALREMVCDKVSRRLQKELGGMICDEMWDVDINFYAGLPKHWLTKSIQLEQLMMSRKET